MSAVFKLVRQVRNYSSSAKAPSHFVNSFRQAMTSLASPAVILTTANKDLKTGILHPRGLTASSFNSLSIKPWPLITFNIQVPSHAADAMRNSNPDVDESKLFAINILPATRSAAKTCRAFAGGLGPNVNPFTHPDIAPYLSFEGLNSRNLEFKDQAVDDQDLVLSNRILEIPVFKTAKAVLYCTQQKAIAVADHEIWVAKVLHVDVQMNETQSSQLNATLVYHNRKFHQLGSEICE